jgi:hypothetical protein
MHFRFDEKFLELTKILEIKNKGNYRGSVPIFRRPKWHFPKIFLVSVFWNTLVQVGVKGVVSVKNARVEQNSLYIF